MGGAAEHREASCRTRALPPQVPQQGWSTVLSRHSQHLGPALGMQQKHLPPGGGCGRFKHRLDQKTPSLFHP